MNKEHTKALIDRFSFIPKKNPLFRSDMNFPMSFDCGDGWFPLIWKLCEDIEKLVDDNTFAVLQVKEKYGTLRFYVGPASDEIYSLIHDAEDSSSEICEICGKPGKLKVRGGWYRTVCEDEEEYQSI